MEGVSAESTAGIDHTVLLRNGSLRGGLLRRVPWSVYEALVTARSDDAGPRMAYLGGDLEIMSPSRLHEAIARMIDRLVLVYAEHVGLPVDAYGSWTLRDAAAGRGIEPDACYVSSNEERAVPDLAVEVRWTRPLVDKLAVYAGLGVPEVWVWQDGRITVHVLRRGRYAAAARSRSLPGIDLDRVAALAASRDQSAAAREFRATLTSAP